MATYKQVSYGSQGSDVTELQKLLNKNGYNLSVDGIFGSKTQAAVKDYQQKNNLAVDGIAGTNTWGALTKAGTPAPTQTAKPATTAKPFEYGAYKPSDAVTQAQQLLNQQLAQKPGAYQSPWQTQLNDTIDKILNRDQFSYDLNADALYQQLRDQYVLQGQQAMMDTMGQAQAMTGGYGNSYAQTAGQQAYQGYLQQLNDRVPDLYQMALDKYQMEGQDLLNQYSMLGAQEEQDYGRYRDQVSDYYTELGRLTDDARYQEEQDYGRYMDGYDMAYGEYRDSVADSQWDQSFAYQQERDKKADEQWQKEFDEAKRQYDQEYALKTTKTQTVTDTTPKKTQTPQKTAPGDSDPTDDYTYTQNGSLTPGRVKTLQRILGVEQDGIYGPATKKAAGGLSADEAYNKYVLGKKPDGSPATDYYDQLLGAVATAKGTTDKSEYSAKSATYKETVAAVNDAYKNGKITKEQKAALLRTAIPGPR